MLSRESRSLSCNQQGPIDLLGVVLFSSLLQTPRSIVWQPFPTIGRWSLTLFHRATRKQNLGKSTIMLLLEGFEDFEMAPDNPRIICNRFVNNILPKSWYKWKVPKFHNFLGSCKNAHLNIGLCTSSPIVFNDYYHDLNGNVMGR